ncbi:alternative ribosome rescue aminoacyl-tRNA hydrolase ArfB [Desulfatitalea tepidiphila]|uniref:alternative ribosome rescue aminoacyl-tRNA hydrolase ArfB n=1 Tax=Desulfatitalea tepidiphila TaxID=1185843 RepID=UPI0006B62526|nr:alternative ribosome rescue aminoacyl-tRNA hydrolase ArfB [Desulfatitalea tepidiphila]
MLPITDTVAIPLGEIDIEAIRAQGAGGQNVNKVASAVHLRFDIPASSLPEPFKERLLKLNDQRITREGVVVIKAQEFRSQEKNRAAALARLQQLIRRAVVTPKRRRPTRPSLKARQKRVDQKVRRGRIKALRTKFEME